jgi:hypothetical protein
MENHLPQNSSIINPLLSTHHTVLFTTRTNYHRFINSSRRRDISLRGEQLSGLGCILRDMALRGGSRRPKIGDLLSSGRRVGSQ